MSHQHRRLAWLSGMLACTAALGSSQQVVRVHTGNGPPEGLDSQVTFLLGPADGPFPQVFTSADFVAARSGPSARLHWRGWSLPSDPAAAEVTTQPDDHTALYAVPFQIQGQPTQATLSIEWVVDNLIGGAPNQGIFINGQTISGNTMGLPGINGPNSVQRSDIAGLLVPGTNYLYVYCHDEGAYAAILFSALITYSLAVPATYATYGTSCAGSAGLPTMQPLGGSLPWLGQRLTLSFAGVPLGRPIFVFVGASSSTWFGQFPLPLDLSGAGMPGCSLYASADYFIGLAISLTNPTTWDLDICNCPELAGVQFYNQGFVYDPPANAMGMTSTNGGGGVIGIR